MCHLRVPHGIKWKASSGKINGFIQVCVLKPNVCLQLQHPTWFWDLKKQNLTQASSTPQCISLYLISILQGKKLTDQTNNSASDHPKTGLGTNYDSCPLWCFFSSIFYSSLSFLVACHALAVFYYKFLYLWNKTHLACNFKCQRENAGTRVIEPLEVLLLNNLSTKHLYAT